MKCVAALLGFISLFSLRTVRIGSSTKNFLTKLKSRTQTLDKSLSVENVGQENGKEKLSGDPREGSEEVHEKPSTWSEHVWSTFIHRGYSDDVTEKQPLVNGKDLLTDFQQDKFKYFFYHVLDLNTDHVISKEDFVKLNQRIKHYMDWSVNTNKFLALQVRISHRLGRSNPAECENSEREKSRKKPSCIPLYWLEFVPPSGEL